MPKFKLTSEYKPAGDQPKAIRSIFSGIEKGYRFQTLLGVTGSGKTFTMANVIASYNKPVLVLAHNKTLAAQLAQEYKSFFPENAVHYFVSYYDYYQPEAYIPATDTYIEKDASINEEIDRLRHASTQALLTRRDVIIVASVSCIYGLGSPKEYEKENLRLDEGSHFTRADLIKKLIGIHFTRTSGELLPGTFRVVGDNIEVMPTGERIVVRAELSAGIISSIIKIDAISSSIVSRERSFFLFPAKHFMTSGTKKEKAIKAITEEMSERVAELEFAGKILEAERLRRRTSYDLALIREVGYCSGIENYSRALSGRIAGTAPDTLLSYFPKTKDGKPDFLTIIDESHVTVPQIRGMFAGDESRKKTLVEHGFRLPSALDNRPLRFQEFLDRTRQIIFTSATPSEYERVESSQVVEQIIRPTGLIDPEIVVKPITEKVTGMGQVKDIMVEAEKVIEKRERVIVTTLSKKMAENASAYFRDKKIKAEYLHSDIKTLERIKILTDFRKGRFDLLVGVNLLREGLDLPEVSLIGILDADKEGFLRSETSLVQTIGRAARNSSGRVILYADVMTGSMERAISETNRRRKMQIEYNKKHKITPKTIIKNIEDITKDLENAHDKAVGVELAVDFAEIRKNPKSRIKILRDKKRKMAVAVKTLDFETAAILRDEIHALESVQNLV